MEAMRETIVVCHGSDAAFDAIDLKRSKNNRDFGVGFYTTTIAAQAEDWARSVRARNGSRDAYVQVYELALADLNVLRFDGLTIEWLDLVKENRSLEGCRHGYDAVVGPVANDNTLLTVNRYIQGIYTADEAIRRLAHFKANDQISLHTPKALERIRLVRRYSVDE